MLSDQEFKEKLGEKLHALRKEKDLTLYQLAQKTESHKSTIMRIERAEVSPSANLLRRIASALEVPSSVFMDLEEVEKN
jgi:transcriptional regulator with XRE-family HTH domain